MASAFDAVLRWASAVPASSSGADATSSGAAAAAAARLVGVEPTTTLLPLLLGTTALALLLTRLLPALVRCWRTRTALGSTPLAADAPLLPGGLPLLGHGLQVLRNLHRIHDWLYEAAAASGFRTVAFTVPFMPAYFLVTDPSCLERVLKTRMHNYVKGRSFRVNFGAILGDGIFTSDGAHWYWQRKLATHIFSVRSFKRYIDQVFSEKIEALAGLLDSAAARQQQQAALPPAGATTNNSSSSGGATSSALQAAAAAPAAASFDLQDAMFRFTLDSFGRIGFGADIGCLKAADARVPFAVAFDEAQVIVNARFWLPAWPLYELLTGRAWRLLRCGAVVRRFARGIVQQRRAQLQAAAKQQQQQQAKASLPAAEGKKGAAAGTGGDDDTSSRGCDQQQEQQQQPGRNSNTQPSLDSADSAADDGDDSGKERDLLALLMTAKRGDGRPLTGRDLMWSTLNYLIAGRDTTAQALTWSFYEIMRRPDVEARLVEEANAVLGSGGDGNGGGSSAGSNKAGEGEGEEEKAGAGAGAGAGKATEAAARQHPSYDQLRKLVYARAVFLEALRLHPSVPENDKFAVEADTLPDGTRIPAGAQTVYSPYVVNRLPGFWGEDALSFNPDRWLAMPAAPSPYQFLSFNAGPRLCVGQRLAELEGVFVLAELLRRYRFERADGGGARDYVVASTLPMRGGLPVRVTVRQ